MMPKLGKRILATVLSCSMTLSMVSFPADVSAAEKKNNALTEQAMKEKLAQAVDSTEYPKGMFAFGESQITGAEGQDSQLLVVRAGGTKGKAKVTLKAIGVSAKYGEDYLMTVQDGKKSTVLEAEGSNETLMEKYGDSLTVKEAEKDQKEQDSVDVKAAVAQQDGEAKLSELSGVAKAAALQNDAAAVQKSWRETNDKKDSSYQGAEQLMAKGKKNLLSAAEKMDGVEYTFTFEDGEYKKEVDLSAIDDELSEGDEQVMFILSDASGAKISENYTGYFNIKDNEQKEPDAYEMAAASVKVKRGSQDVELTVNKTAGTEKLSVLNVGTSELTAKAGTDYEAVNEALVFAPGMTSKTVKIPLVADADTKEDVSFYVGLSTADGVVNTEKKATLVTITADKAIEGTVAEEVVFSGKAGVKANERSQDKGSKTVSASRTTSERHVTVFSGENLSTASRIEIKYSSTGGSTTVKEGCDKVKKSDRKVWFKLGTEEQNCGTGSSVSGTCTFSDVSSKGKNVSLTAYVQPMNKNENAELKVTSVKIYYPEYVLSVDNEYANGSKASNEYNAYQEKRFTGSNASSNVGSLIRLGQMYINNSTKKSVYYPSDSVTLSWAYDTNSKTSNNVKPGSSNTDFKGYQIYNAGSKQWVDLGTGSSYTLESLLSKSGRSTTSISLRPKFQVKKANLKFLNNGSIKMEKKGTDGTTSYENLSQAKLGSFKGFNNGSTLTDATLLDSIEIVGVPNKGYSIAGFSTIDSKTKKAVPQIAKSLGNEITLVPSTTNQINVDIQYQESMIRVMADPSGDNTDKGAVLYVDPSDPSKAISGEKGKPMDITGIETGMTYSIIGQADPSTSTDKYQYRAVWSDGTLDSLEEDGKISEKEKEAGSGYKGFEPVSGNVLAFSPSVSYTKIYYDFEMREVITDKANMHYLTGRVFLKDKELFTQKSSTTELNGVQVMADGDTDTTKYYAGDRYTNAGGGYYEMSGDGTYLKKDRMLVTFTYNAGDGCSMSENVVCNPDIFQNVYFSTDSVMDIASATVSLVDDEEETETSVAWNAMNNGDKHYRMKFKVNSRNSDVQPRKAVLRFYSKDGSEYANKAITQAIEPKDNGQFVFDFNPKELELAPGTTMTFQVLDQNDRKYYERSTGIYLMESIGMIDFANSFEFGGANTVISLVGNIDSKFNLGWNGEFDADTNENIVVDDEGNMVLSLGFSSGDIAKEVSSPEQFDSVAEKAVAKATAQRAYIDKTKELAQKKGGPTAQDQQDLEKLKQTMETSGKDFDDEMARSTTAEESTTDVGAGVSATVDVSLEICFARDDDKNAYYFKSMVIGATVSGGVDVNVSFATPIGITISLGFGLGVDDSGATFIIAENDQLGNPPRYYLTSGEKDSLVQKDQDGSSKIDLFNFRGDGNNPYTREGIFDVNPYITLSAGAGVLGDLINVTVSGTAQFNMTFYTSEEENEGSVNLSAEIGVKVLFISASWPFLSKNVSLFGNNSVTAATGMDDLNYLHDSANVLQAESRDYFENRSKWLGSGFSMKSLDENENGVAEATLREGIYSGTNVQLAALNNGDYLGVFLDDETDDQNKPVRTSLNSAAVHYAIYDHTTGQWGKPALLEDDKKVDQDLSVFDLGDRGIMVTWSAANKEFTDDDSRIDMMNAMDIHGAFFDKTTKKFGAIMNITKETEVKNKEIGSDTSADVSPNVAFNGQYMMVYYTKNDYAVSDTAEGEVVGDTVYPVSSLMAYRVYKFSGEAGTDGTWIEDYQELPDNQETYNGIKDDIENGYYGEGATYEDYMATLYGQVLFNTVPDVYLDEQLDDQGYWKDNAEPTSYKGHTVQSNVDADSKKSEAGVLDKENTQVTGSNDTVSEVYAPKIIDTDAISYNNMGLFAYTVDYDQSMSTINDRDVYIQIFDFEKGTMSHPIMVTSDNVSDSNVKFTRVSSKEMKTEGAETYLTWLSDGDIVALNISNVVQNCLLERTTEDGSTYYIIDKSKATDPKDQKYLPPSVMVEGEVAEDQENAVSSISSFDVNSTEGYVYVSWTEQKSELKDGVEEGSEEAAKAENQCIETQVYMARYDLAEGAMTGAVQVTSGEGDNYDNLAFVVNSDASLTALATKAESKTVTADEFNETVEDYNSTHSKDEAEDKVTEEDFVEYTAPDYENKSLVAMNITPVSVMKVDNTTMESLTSGEENYVSVSLLNDGIDTLDGATLTITDQNGESVLQQQKNKEDGTIDTDDAMETVDSIALPKLMGGNTYDATAKVVLGEKDTEASIIVTLKDKDGKELINQTISEKLEEDTLIQGFQVEETDDRDVYQATVEIQNADARYAEEGKAVIGIETKDGKTPLKTVSVKELERGEGITINEELSVDSAKQFTKTEGENGFIQETGKFYVEYKGKTANKDVVRTASGAQMDEMNAIEDGMIGDGEAMQVAVGYTETAVANIKSKNADDKTGLTGTEGLQVVWETGDDGIATVDDAGNVTGIQEGETTLTAYVMPKNSDVSAAVNETQADSAADGSVSYNFGSEISNYVSLPNDAIKTYSIKLAVKQAAETPTATPPADTPAPPADTPAPPAGTTAPKQDSVVKNGVTYQVSGNTATVTKTDKKATSVTIPASIKIGGKSYKVKKIAANVFKNSKKLKKVVIGKNVQSIGKNAFNGCKSLKSVTFKSTKALTIGKNAFKGCKSLKSVTFKGKKAPKIGKNAFKGIAAKAVFKVPKAAKKKYKKVLVKKAGVTAKMKIKA